MTNIFNMLCMRSSGRLGKLVSIPTTYCSYTFIPAAACSSALATAPPAPALSSVAAIVSADVDTGEEVDTQITDAEVIVSAHLLRSMYEAHAAAAYARTGEALAPGRLGFESGVAVATAADLLRVAGLAVTAEALETRAEVAE